MNNEKNVQFLNSNSSILYTFNQNIPGKRKIDSKSMSNAQNPKKDLWFFKNDILKDVKNFEKNLTEQYNKGDIEIKEEILKINNNINSIKEKISELATLITTDKMVKEKVDKLEKLNNKNFDRILTNEIKINRVEKEAQESIIRMNNILKETVIYNGLIGPSCKFNNFHELIDYILNELFLLDNFKDKNIMDLSSYKKKVEGIINGFKLQIDNINKASYQFTIENFGICDGKIKEFRQKFEKIIDHFENDFQRVNNKFEEIEKDINGIKNENINNANNFKEHIEKFLNLKENFIKLNDIINQQNSPPINIRNSFFKRLESKKTFEGNVDNINKNKIKKMNSSLKTEFIEELKNHKLNIINEIKSNDNFIDSDEMNLQKYNNISPKNINESEKKKNLKNLLNIKNNSKTNLKINLDNLNLSSNLEKKSEKSFDKMLKKVTNNYMTFYGKKTKSNLLLSDSEDNENKKNHSRKSPNIILNKTNTNSIEEEEEKKPDEMIRQTIIIKGNNKNNKNIFNKQKIKLNSPNSIHFSDLNKFNTINSAHSNIKERFLNTKKKLSSSKYKNIILTLEGSKKLIIDSKDSENGKNIYHIESLNIKKNPKSNINERLISSKPYLIDTKSCKLYNDVPCLPKDDFENQVKIKNAKIIYLNKSESHRVLMKNNIKNLYIENKNINSKEFEPTFNLTHYSPLSTNRVLNLNKKIYQKMKENNEAINKNNINNKKK